MGEILEKEKFINFFNEINSETNLTVSNDFSCVNLENSLSNMTLFHINEMTFEEKENKLRREAFENVLGAIREDGVNFIYLILGNKKGVSFYFGIVKDLRENKELTMPVLEMGDTLLKSSVCGNFRGSKIKKLSPQENKDILSKIKSSKRFGAITGVPGINDSDDKNNFQGIDRLVDVMHGKEFGLCIIAKPVKDLEIKDLEKKLCSIYNNISAYSKFNIQSGYNNSNSIGETKGTNISNSNGKSLSKGESNNKSASITDGYNVSYSESKGESTSESKGKNKSTSEGYTISDAKGGTNTHTKGENKNTSNGENSGSSESKSKNNTDSYGVNHSESSSKSQGESTSEGSSTSETKGENESITENKTKGLSLNLSQEISNKEFQDYLKYFDEILFPMLDYGRGKGLYITNSFVFSDNKGILIQLGNTMRSLFSGRKGNKTPIKLELLTEKDERLNYFKNFQIPVYDSFKFSEEKKNALVLKSLWPINNQSLFGNWYSSNELSLIAGLPQKEIVGLTVKEEVEFGLNMKEIKGEKINLGNLVQSGNELDIDVSLDRADLNKHIFITGVTGTGKTTTCQKLLLESKMPFLVIEPAKTEYRVLIDKEETKDVLIFTLGKDTVAPFRLNPFEFFPHESITSRVDMLKAAIESSFEMEAAIPQLIESSIYSCYEDYGWDISDNENYNFDNPFEKGVSSFPTLEDLLNKVEEEVSKQGFDEKLKKDYIGSIKARLQGLLIGSKGLMLNVKRGLDFRELIEKKVVLEIEEIKNGSEKSLIMGFVLTNLVEALKAKYHENRDFKHITLVEEAHRLFSKYSYGDSPNKKQGIETFTDMLAEVRKYGESLIIADQIPNKLAPEILKNTNSKIIHKIFAEDDKEAIGNTISLTKEQKNFLSSLNTGRAIIFSQGWDKALQVQIKRGTNTTGEKDYKDNELTDRIISFYYENKEFFGMKYFHKKPSIIEFNKCRKLFSNQKLVKIIDKFENLDDNFKEFNFVLEFLIDYKFWKTYENLVLKIECKNREYFQNRLVEFIKKYSLNFLVEIIVDKYYSSDFKTDEQDMLKKFLSNVKDNKEDFFEGIETDEEKYLVKKMVIK